MKPAGDERTPDGGRVAADRPAREQLLVLTRDERPDASVLMVTGSVDGLTAGRLRAAITQGFDDRDGRPLVVDLTKVGFFGSSGLRALFEAADKASDRPGFEPLRIVVDHNRPVIRAIELVGLDGILALYHDVATATAGEQEIGR